MRELSVVTNQLTANNILESWFIQNLVLQDLPLGLEWEVDNLHDGVVVYLELGELNRELIAGLRARNNKVVLCQLGDEYLKKYDRDAYLACDLILRPYYFPELFEDPELAARTHWIPNGYKSGIGPRNSAAHRKATQRRFIATFLGWLDNKASFGDERASFQKVALANPQDILLTPTAYFGLGFSVGMYSAVMEAAVFCPCPAGNSPETIRLYDALELGCLPISLKHGFLTSSDALASPPFPLLDSWEELPALLARYRDEIARDPQSINRQQEECVAWWDLYKATLKAKVGNLLLELRRS